MRPLGLLIEGPDDVDTIDDKRDGNNANGAGAMGLPKIPSVIDTPYQSLNLLKEDILEEPEEDDDMFEEGAPPTMIDIESQREARRKSIAVMRQAQQQKHMMHLRRNKSTPGFGKLTRITGLDGPPDPGSEHVIFGT